MNILFYTGFKASPTLGGVEHATISIAYGLRNKYGCRCFSAYHIERDTSMVDCFEAEYVWNDFKQTDGIIRFCRDNDINCIINQGELNLSKQFRIIADIIGCKVLFVHHFTPGWESHFMTFQDVSSGLKSPNYSIKLKALAKMILFPYLRLNHLYTLRKKYWNSYYFSDRVVLLCKGFIPLYSQYGRIDDDERYVVIPNALSYNVFFQEEKITQKKPVILIVSRLEEMQKRISFALRIWNEVKKHEESKAWRLNIIGHGYDEKKYRRIIKDQNIPDVSLLGRQEPKAYYEEASVFVMTSKSEGFPLTLLEAQQFGVVPIAFDTFSSLSDIIKNEENGIIIPECDENMYVRKLLQILKDRELREKMSSNAIRNSKKFSQADIVNIWWNTIK